MNKNVEKIRVNFYSDRIEMEVKFINQITNYFNIVEHNLYRYMSGLVYNKKLSFDQIQDIEICCSSNCEQAKLFCEIINKSGYLKINNILQQYEDQQKQEYQKQLKQYQEDQRKKYQLYNEQQKQIQERFSERFPDQPTNNEIKNTWIQNYQKNQNNNNNIHSKKRYRNVKIQDTQSSSIGFLPRSSNFLPRSSNFLPRSSNLSSNLNKINNNWDNKNDWDEQDDWETNQIDWDEQDDWETNQFDWDNYVSDNESNDDEPKESFIDYLSSDDDEWNNLPIFNEKQSNNYKSDNDLSDYVDEIL